MLACYLWQVFAKHRPTAAPATSCACCLPHLPSHSPLPPCNSLYCRGQILATHPPYARRTFVRLLSAARVRLFENTPIASVAPGRLLLTDGAAAPFDECLWCTQAAAAGWLGDTGLPLDPDGFIAIDECLQVDPAAGGPPGVFACGDVASSAAHPRPKAGVFAVRQVRRRGGGRAASGRRLQLAMISGAYDSLP